ncbi:MAG: hypothetical protein GF353_04390 [Candidatus Lokiarchaeota archaeon]|nr:hypothetical protein [Candidatus Lokiarchaeota archaeon]
MELTKNGAILTKTLNSGVKNLHKCPVCGEQIKLSVKNETLDSFKLNDRDLFPHINIHGNPQHAILCYIDKDRRVRSLTSVQSVEII